MLKLDQEGFAALAHNVEIGELLGGLGFWFTKVADNVPLLVRLNDAHVMIIPGLIVVLLVLHALLVKRHGISPTRSSPSRPRSRRTVYPTTCSAARMAACPCAREDSGGAEEDR